MTTNATDRELLEKAARAAGIEGWWEAGYLSFIKRSGGPWRPLEDDGDAFRLAVKLGFTVATYAQGIYVASPTGKILAAAPECATIDADRIVRRAITRAAAAMADAQEQ